MPMGFETSRFGSIQPTEKAAGAPPIPPLKRVVSGGQGGIPRVSLARQTSGGAQSDWRTFMSIEERQSIRDKIRSAYTSHCSSFDELLDTVVAIEEEMVHASAPSRLDYFKTGLEYESRVAAKRGQLEGGKDDSADEGRSSKRQRGENTSGSTS